MGGIAGGIFGGIDAANNDREFWTGADKQSGVVKINPDGTAKFTGTEDYKPDNSLQVNNCKTQIVDGKNISIDDNYVNIKMPDNVDGFINIEVDPTKVVTSPSYNHGILRIHTWEPLDNVTINCFRYRSNPITSLRNMFYWRSITPIIKWF